MNLESCFVDGLHPVVVGGLGTRWGWRFVWGDGSDQWKSYNHLLSTQNENLLNSLYIEPKNEEIVKTFFSVADEEGK